MFHTFFGLAPKSATHYAVSIPYITIIFSSFFFTINYRIFSFFLEKEVESYEARSSHVVTSASTPNLITCRKPFKNSYKLTRALQRHGKYWDRRGQDYKEQATTSQI